MNKKDLWQAIKWYHFDHLVPPSFWDVVKETFGGYDASTKAFANKIERKHNWDFNLAMKAIFEYKKFVYLGVISDFAVTPSKIIDVVWHEHLLFTDAYRTFCNDIIKHEFNHYPELMVDELQTKKFETQFQKTLDLYQSEFGIKPPDAIWGLAKFEKRITYNDDSSSIGGSMMDYQGDSAPLYSHYSDEMASGASSPEFSDSEGFDGGGAEGSWSDSDTSSDNGDSGADGGGCSGGCGD